MQDMNDTPSKPVVLAVDDTPENLDVVKGILAGDYTVKAAINGQMALKIIEKAPPDIILLDIMMPGMSGYEVCERLKADPDTRDIPVIFLTAMEQTTDEAKGFELGAADYITKPVNPPILEARVRTHLALKFAMDDLQSAYAVIKKQKDRMQEELNVGRDIQMSMLPMEFPPFPDRSEFDLHALLKPAREVGGDFYDYFFVSDDEICLVVGDVSGKGVPAALFMAVTKTMLKTSALGDPSPASIFTRVNDELSADNPASMFVTMFLALVNVRTGEFRYSNAGHNPPYLIHKGKGFTCLNQRHGPIIGAMPGIAYKESDGQLVENDTLYIFTDGVTEAMDADGNLFSERRLEEFFGRQDDATSKSIADASLQEVEEYALGIEQADDITILAFRFSRSKIEVAGHILDLSVAPDLAQIRKVNDSVESFCGEAGLPASIAQKLGIILDELLNNTISYGFNDEVEHEIQIHIEYADERVVVKVSDDGVPFNPFDQIGPDTTLSVEERELGGLGILLVKEMTDSQAYQRQSNRNIITLTINTED
jgi:sigma-B regulation protein RsbU (phosphoserine phosphatase)